MLRKSALPATTFSLQTGRTTKMTEYRIVVHGILDRELAEALAKQLEQGMPSSMHVGIEEIRERHDIEEAGDPQGDEPEGLHTGPRA